MEEAAKGVPPIEAPRGMYPGHLDDRGRLKLAAPFQQYLGSLPDKKLFVTSLDRKVAQIYPIEVWRANEKVLAEYRENPVARRKVLFNAQDLGAEAEMDSQGRVLFSPELRRTLGIENQPVHIYCVRGRIEVLSDAVYGDSKTEASISPEQAVEELERAGLM